MENQSDFELVWFFTAIKKETKERIDGRIKAMTIDEAIKKLQRQGLVISAIRCNIKNPQRMYELYRRWLSFFKRNDVDIKASGPNNVLSIDKYLKEETKDS